MTAAKLFVCVRAWLVLAVSFSHGGAVSPGDTEDGDLGRLKTCRQRVGSLEQQLMRTEQQLLDERQENVATVADMQRQIDANVVQRADSEVPGPQEENGRAESAWRRRTQDGGAEIEYVFKRTISHSHLSKAVDESNGGHRLLGENGGASCSNTEISRQLAAINTECCDEPSEDCSGGMVHTCNAGCGDLVMPLWAACQDKLGGVLGDAGVKTFGAAAVLCPPVSGSAGATALQEPQAGNSSRSACGSEFSARAYGAAGDGLTLDTTAIQTALDAAGNASSSSPCAVLESGIFLSGSVFLRPGVTLYIDITAVLKGSLDHAHFIPDAGDWPGQAVLVSGAYADGAAVAGGGVIDGQAPMFVTSLDGASDQLKFGTDGWAYPVIDRVRLVEFKHSTGVRVTGITLQDGTGFHLHFLKTASQSTVTCAGPTTTGSTSPPATTPSSATLSSRPVTTPSLLRLGSTTVPCTTSRSRAANSAHALAGYISAPVRGMTTSISPSAMWS